MAPQSPDYRDGFFWVTITMMGDYKIRFAEELIEVIDRVFRLADEGDGYVESIINTREIREIDAKINVIAPLTGLVDEYWRAGLNPADLSHYEYTKATSVDGEWVDSCPWPVPGELIELREKARVFLVINDHSENTKAQLNIATDTSKNIADLDEENKPKSFQIPSKEANQAYKLYGIYNNQTEVAKIMTKELKRPVAQGQVSRWVKQVEEWRKIEDLPTDEYKKPDTIVDSDILDQGARTDGRRTGDPRHSKKKNTY